MWCCVYWYIICCHHLQVRRNEWKCEQHVFPKLWCLSTNPWVCDMTFQKTTIFIVIYVQWIPGSVPLKTKVNWKMKLTIQFRLFFWSEQLSWFLSNNLNNIRGNLNNTHIWNTLQERTEKFWQFYPKHYNINIFTALYNTRFVKLINSHERDKHWSEHQIALHFFIWFCRYELKICVCSSIVICQ